MSDKLKKSILDIAKELKDVPRAKSRHFSFIVYDEDIISLGYNDYFQSNPLSLRFGHGFSGMHSEISAVIKYNGRKRLLDKCDIYNVRVNRFSKISMSKPCKFCERFIKRMGFRNVYYTNFFGEWEGYKV